MSPFIQGGIGRLGVKRHSIANAKAHRSNSSRSHLRVGPLTNEQLTQLGVTRLI